MLSQVFSGIGIFSLKICLLELELKVCLVFFLKKVDPNSFFLPLFHQTLAFRVLFHLLICSLCAQQLALLPAVICPVAAGYAFDVKLGLCDCCLPSPANIGVWTCGLGEARGRERLVKEKKKKKIMELVLFSFSLEKTIKNMMNCLLRTVLKCFGQRF